MGYGAARAKAIQDGKYDEPEKSDGKQEKDTRNKGQPNVEWWMSKVESLGDKAAQLTVQDVQEMIAAEWTGTVSPTTLYNWQQRANKARERND